MVSPRIPPHVAGDLGIDDRSVSLSGALLEPFELGPEPGNNLVQQPTDLVFNRSPVDGGEHRIDGCDPKVPVNEAEADGRRGGDALEEGKQFGRAGLRVPHRGQPRDT
jgi:hypothetical protein